MIIVFIGVGCITFLLGSWLLLPKCRKTLKEFKIFLKQAIIQGDLHQIKSLLREGALVLFDNDKNRGVFMRLAVVYGHIEILQYFNTSNLFPVLKANNFDTYILSIAIGNGDIPMASYLQSIGIVCEYSYELQVVYEQTALKGHISMVEYLQERKVFLQMSSKDKHGRGLLHKASAAGQLELIKYCIQHDAFLHMTDKMGYTALDIAAIHGHIDIVHYLESIGAHVNVFTIDSESRTLFEQCAIHGSLEVMQYLETKGSEIQQINTATMELVAVNGHLEVLKYLEERGVLFDVYSLDNTGNSIMYRTAINGNVPMVKYLKWKGAELNWFSSDEDGNTVIDLAVARGHVPMVHYLESCGAVINICAKDKKGRTLLHRASAAGHVDIVRYLDEKGAFIDTKASDGRTALDVAASHGHIDVVEYLVSKGASITNIDKKGRTARDAVIARGHVDMVEYLEDLLE
jgi:ankyrin repeat protein